MPRASNRTRSRSRGKIRYAVVGLGHIAQAAVLPAFAHAGRNSVVSALVSSDEQKLRRLGRRYRVPRRCGYEDYQALLTSGEIDAVYIALPNDMHKDFGVRAARAEIHVLVEKPMAVSARDCAAMIGAARSAHVKLMVAYRLHFERTNLEAARLARSGKLGSLRYFSSDFSLQVRADNIRLERAHGGGPLYDIGIYCINAARYGLGAEPVAVWAAAARSSDARFREIDETVIAVMRYRDGRLASFTASFGAADRSTYTIVGTRGSVTLDPAYEYAEGLGYRLKVGERTRSKQFAKRDQFAAELLYFSDCILNDRPPEPDGAEGLADVRIIEAMMRSIRTGRWVAVATPGRRRRATLSQDIRRPAVPREPKLVRARASSR